jgi:hypothetical protein
LARTVRVDVTESMRRYWLDRYTLDEILELGTGLLRIKCELRPR